MVARRRRNRKKNLPAREPLQSARQGIRPGGTLRRIYFRSILVFYNEYLYSFCF
jgi:hypothetical protein